MRRCVEARAGLLLLLLPLSGCSSLGLLPGWELLKAASDGASQAVSAHGARASNSLHQLQQPLSELCIELNAESPVPDLLPALQQELLRNGVSSRAYAAGTPRVSCEHWLRYTAWLEFDVRPLQSQPSSYLRSATLSLHGNDGRLLAFSQYESGDGFMTGKWASTRDKLAPVVSALVNGR